MALRDALNEINDTELTQTKDYREQGSKSQPTSSSDSTTTSTNGDIEESTKREVNNPFKRSEGEGSGISGLLSNKKVLLVGGGVILVIIVVIVLLSSKPSSVDEGADFLAELEQSSLFQYTVEERDTLRTNGYTADDIEAYQAAETDPYTLVEEAKQKRKELNEEEMKPLLDGASPKYKQLEAMTWLGTGKISPQVIANAEGSYEERYGTYNCDYTKVEAHGSQLFVKLILKELKNQSIFMTLTPSRYNELDSTGNMVVLIEYNKYADGSILVTNVQEKDIKN